MPTNKTDFVTMLHDIQYLQYNNADVTNVDALAILNSDNSLAGLATKTGLGLRLFTGLRFNDTPEGLTPQRTKEVGNTLMKYIKTNPMYKHLFYQYKVNPDLYMTQV